MYKELQNTFIKIDDSKTLLNLLNNIVKSPQCDTNELIGFQNKINEYLKNSVKAKVEVLYLENMDLKKNKLEGFMLKTYQKNRGGKYLLYVFGLLLFALLTKLNFLSSPPGIKIGLA